MANCAKNLIVEEPVTVFRQEVMQEESLIPIAIKQTERLRVLLRKSAFFFLSLLERPRIVRIVGPGMREEEFNPMEYHAKMDPFGGIKC